MNRKSLTIKSFAAGFTAMDSVIARVSAAKGSVVHVAKSTARGAVGSAQAAKNGIVHVAKTTALGAQAAKNNVVHVAKTTALGAQVSAEVVTSFFACVNQAVKYRRGTCRVLANDVRGSGE